MKGYKVTDFHRATYQETDILPPIGTWTKRKPNAMNAWLCSNLVWHLTTDPIEAFQYWSPKNTNGLLPDRYARYLWEVEGQGLLAKDAMTPSKLGYRRIRLLRLVGIVTRSIARQAIEGGLPRKTTKVQQRLFLKLTREKLAAVKRKSEGKHIRSMIE